MAAQPPPPAWLRKATADHLVFSLETAGDAAGRRTKADAAEAAAAVGDLLYPLLPPHQQAVVGWQLSDQSYIRTALLQLAGPPSKLRCQLESVKWVLARRAELKATGVKAKLCEEIVTASRADVLKSGSRLYSHELEAACIFNAFLDDGMFVNIKPDDERFADVDDDHPLFGGHLCGADANMWGLDGIGDDGGGLSDVDGRPLSALDHSKCLMAFCRFNDNGFLMDSIPLFESRITQRAADRKLGTALTSTWSVPGVVGGARLLRSHIFASRVALARMLVLHALELGVVNDLYGWMFRALGAYWDINVVVLRFVGGCKAAEHPEYSNDGCNYYRFTDLNGDYLHQANARVHVAYWAQTLSEDVARPLLILLDAPGRTGVLVEQGTDIRNGAVRIMLAKLAKEQPGGARVISRGQPGVNLDVQRRCEREYYRLLQVLGLAPGGDAPLTTTDDAVAYAAVHRHFRMDVAVAMQSKPLDGMACQQARDVARAPPRAPDALDVGVYAFSRALHGAAVAGDIVVVVPTGLVSAGQVVEITASKVLSSTDVLSELGDRARQAAEATNSANDELEVWVGAISDDWEQVDNIIAEQLVGYRPFNEDVANVVWAAAETCRQTARHEHDMLVDKVVKLQQRVANLGPAEDGDGIAVQNAREMLKVVMCMPLRWRVALRQQLNLLEYALNVAEREVAAVAKVATDIANEAVANQVSKKATVAGKVAASIASANVASEAAAGQLSDEATGETAVGVASEKAVGGVVSEVAVSVFGEKTAVVEAANGVVSKVTASDAASVLGEAAESQLSEVAASVSGEAAAAQFSEVAASASGEAAARELSVIGEAAASQLSEVAASASGEAAAGQVSVIGEVAASLAISVASEETTGVTSETTAGCASEAADDIAIEATIGVEAAVGIEATIGVEAAAGIASKAVASQVGNEEATGETDGQLGDEEAMFHQIGATDKEATDEEATVQPSEEAIAGEDAAGPAPSHKFLFDQLNNVGEFHILRNAEYKSLCTSMFTAIMNDAESMSDDVLVVFFTLTACNFAFVKNRYSLLGGGSVDAYVLYGLYYAVAYHAYEHVFGARDVKQWLPTQHQRGFLVDCPTNYYVALRAIIAAVRNKEKEEPGCFDRTSAQWANVWKANHVVRTVFRYFKKVTLEDVKTVGKVTLERCDTVSGKRETVTGTLSAGALDAAPVDALAAAPAAAAAAAPAAAADRATAKRRGSADTGDAGDADICTGQTAAKRTAIRAMINAKGSTNFSDTAAEDGANAKKQADGAVKAAAEAEEEEEEDQDCEGQQNEEDDEEEDEDDEKQNEKNKEKGEVSMQAAATSSAAAATSSAAAATSSAAAATSSAAAATSSAAATSFKAKRRQSFGQEPEAKRHGCDDWRDTIRDFRESLLLEDDGKIISLSRLVPVSHCDTRKIYPLPLYEAESIPPMYSRVVEGFRLDVYYEGDVLIVTACKAAYCLMKPSPMALPMEEVKMWTDKKSCKVITSKADLLDMMVEMLVLNDKRLLPSIVNGWAELEHTNGNHKRCELTLSLCRPCHLAAIGRYDFKAAVNESASMLDDFLRCGAAKTKGCC